MTYESFKTFRTKLLTFFRNEIRYCNYRTNEYAVDIYFPEYNNAVQIYEINKEILRANKSKEDTNCTLININLDKRHFGSFSEIIKIKNSLPDVFKNRLSVNDKLITRLNSKIKEIYYTLLKCRNLIL